MDPIQWEDLKQLESFSYRCGYCGGEIASERGYTGILPGTRFQSERVSIYICHKCLRPTFIDSGNRQTPGSYFGESVKDVSDASVARIYGEARQAYSASAFTATVLCCRKLLMHISVAKGAAPGESFKHYVEFLWEKHYIPPDSLDWVDHIRAKGNEANHEITLASREDAEELISFCGVLLKIIFEFPAASKKKAKK